MRIRAGAAGRVNLIGDHTDYMGGLALPMTIDRFTVVEGVPTPDSATVRLVSDSEPEPAVFGLPAPDPSGMEPQWAAYPAAVAHEFGITTGFTGTVTSTIPRGAGLSSSASLELATALALLAAQRRPLPEPLELALACQRAEHLAVGVPSGLMDQLCIATGRAGHASLIDFTNSEVSHVAVPDDAHVWVVHSGTERRLASSAYGERRASAEAAAALLGPLRDAGADAMEALDDPILVRRARHVHGECRRVERFVQALEAGDLRGAGSEMLASHRSLRDDYEVSTPALDALVETLAATAGVFGARMTGAGFGGCVVALTSASFDLAALGGGMRGWSVRAVDGIHLDRG